MSLRTVTRLKGSRRARGQTRRDTEDTMTTNADRSTEAHLGRPPIVDMATWTAAR